MSFKLTIKTLKGNIIKIDVDPSSKVTEIKSKIEELEGHPVASQKLICKGKILADDKTLQFYDILSDKEFMVLMVAMPKPSGSATTSTHGTTSTSTNNPTLTESAQAPAPAINPITPTSDTVVTTSTAPPAPAAPAPAPAPALTPATSTISEMPVQSTPVDYDHTGMATGQFYESAVQNMIEMGFDRAQVQRAMRASFNNPDRAVEYLMTGIPEGLGITQPTVVAPPSPHAPATPIAAQQTNPQNLFTAGSQQAAAAQQAQQAQQAAGATSDLSFLRNQPQFQQLRQLVQSNPQLLQPLLQQLGQANPELMQLINSNQQAFLQLLNDGEDDDGEGGTPAGVQHIQVTPDENASIARLEALGFDRITVIQAYFACDKNEEVAANYLFEHGNDEDWH